MKTYICVIKLTVIPRAAIIAKFGVRSYEVERIQGCDGQAKSARHTPNYLEMRKL